LQGVEWEGDSNRGAMIWRRDQAGPNQMGQSGPSGSFAESGHAQKLASGCWAGGEQVHDRRGGFDSVSRISGRSFRARPRLTDQSPWVKG
jgi:hypothetical protein